MKTCSNVVYKCRRLAGTLNKLWSKPKPGELGFYKARVNLLVGPKYVRFVVSYNLGEGKGLPLAERPRSVLMFVEIATGYCLKPLSYKSPDPPVLYNIDHLREYPELCDRHGVFLLGSKLQPKYLL